MNAAFSKNLVMLRKERGLSQKKVSEDLSISQALLSHYEKGIRECGLDFVVNAADYFGVSCDFLLGRSERREMFRGEKASKSQDNGKSSALSGITGTVSIVFAILKKINSKSLTREVAHYLRAAVYTIFRILYSANEKNSPELFSLRRELYPAVTASQMSLSAAKCMGMLSGESFDGGEKIRREELPQLSPESLASEFPRFSPALFDLIESTENWKG